MKEKDQIVVPVESISGSSPMSWALAGCLGFFFVFFLFCLLCLVPQLSQEGGHGGVKLVGPAEDAYSMVLTQKMNGKK